VHHSPITASRTQTFRFFREVPQPQQEQEHNRAAGNSVTKSL
jgi:hypothetical protein